MVQLEHHFGPHRAWGCRGQRWAPKVATLPRFGGLDGATHVALTGVWRAGTVLVSGPNPIQNLGGSMVFSRPSKGSAVALWGTHARARDVKRFTFLVV